MNSSQKPAAPEKNKYALEFNDQAWKEWKKLNSTIQLQFAKKLKEALRIRGWSQTSCVGCLTATRSSLEAPGIALFTKW